MVVRPWQSRQGASHPPLPRAPRPMATLPAPVCLLAPDVHGAPKQTPKRLATIRPPDRYDLAWCTSGCAQELPYHTRKISFDDLQPGDGLWEVEGQSRDTRGFDIRTRWRGQIAQGTSLRGMRICIVFGEDPATCAQAPADHRRPRTALPSNE